MIPRSRIAAIIAGYSKRNVFSSSNFAFKRVSAECASFQENKSPTNSNRFLPVAPPQIDILQQVILAAEQQDQLFTLIEQHAVVMSNKHLLICLEKFKEMVKHGSPADSIRNADAFQTLMKTISLRLPLLNANDCWIILANLKFFEVEPFSAIVDLICNEFRLKIKDLSLMQLLLLQRLLSSYSSPTSDVMRLTIPILFQSRVPIDFDAQNPTLCYRAFNFVLFTKIDQQTREFVAEATLKHCRNFSPSQALVILRSAGSGVVLMQDIPAQRSESALSKTLKTCMETVTSNIHLFSEDEIEKVLRVSRLFQIGSVGIFDTLWSKAETFPSYDTFLSLLTASIGANYMTLPLADQVVDWILQKQTKISHFERLNLSKLAEPIATCVLHNEPNSDKVRRAFEAANILIDTEPKNDHLRQKPGQLLNFILSICLTGKRPTHLLDVLFSEACQKRIQELRKVHLLFELDECLKLSLENLPKYEILPEIQNTTLSNSNDLINRKMLAFVQTALGGQQFVASNVMLPFGHKLRIVVAMSKEGVAIPMPSTLHDNNPIEKLPAQSKVVAVITCRNKTYVTGLLRNLLAYKMSQLKKQNICTLLLDLEEFQSLAEQEKLPFIVKGLRSAVESGPMFSSNTFNQITV